ncbi:hypothetical protein B9Z55_022877 [Caenorhabditis nigoni]|uniref:Uncharacterized protein n=1 Tax=Caenorhabditis nigoni TaxID=1611254 RepID=A0A2G5SMT0_9PELO|nr:hypothetical protein B9Z55_022877 [Caenorhabditis nigoni]
MYAFKVVWPTAWEDIKWSVMPTPAAKMQTTTDIKRCTKFVTNTFVLPQYEIVSLNTTWAREENSRSYHFKVRMCMCRKGYRPRRLAAFINY